jgi:hypothetical protein
MRAATALALALAGCGGGRGALDLPPFEFLEPSSPTAVDAVVFLVGDGGESIAGRSPVIAKLSADVEEWSGAIARDSAVSVIFLGDNVYPYGMRGPEDPNYPADSTRLWTQIEVVGGPEARQHGSSAWFLPGNHDWGQTRGDEGLARVMNQDLALEAAQDLGYNVDFVPPGGDPGPFVHDLRRNVRLIAIDTHWFLQERAVAARDEFFERITEALVSAGDREVIIMAHHPYTSAGPHGALVATTRAMGLLYLLKKSGTLIQDLNSPIYTDFLARLGRAFEEAGGPPLIFAGGHDHSLQVHLAQRPMDPRFSLVSGAASKLSEVSQVPGLGYAAARPGYMMLVFKTDDSVELYVTGGDPNRLICDQPDVTEQATCMSEAVAAFETVYSGSILSGTVIVPEPLSEADTVIQLDTLSQPDTVIFLDPQAQPDTVIIPDAPFDTVIQTDTVRLP